MSATLRGILILLAFAALVHGLSLWNPFYLDDFAILRGNAWFSMTDLFAWSRRFYADPFQTFPAYRPTLMASFHVSALLTGPDAWSFRIGNVLIHLTNAILLGSLLRLALPGQYSARLAWISALLFLIHPAQTLPINLLWKRSSLLETAWILGGLLLHVRERRRNGSYRWAVSLAVAALSLLAMTTKESGVLFPFYLAVAEFVWCDRLTRKSSTGPIALLFLLCAVFSLGFVTMRFALLDQWYSEHFTTLAYRSTPDRFEYAAIALSHVPLYLRLWLFPSPRIVEDPQAWTPYSWLGVVATIALAAFSTFLVIRRRHPIVTPAIAFFWISILPTLGFLPVFFPIDPVRLYFPLIGLSALFATGLVELGAKLKTMHLLPLILVVAIYSTQTITQHIRYRTPILIWSDVVSAYPKSAFAWSELAVSFDDANLLESATEGYETAVRLEPNEPRYRVHLLDVLTRSAPTHEKAKGMLNGLIRENLPSREWVLLSQIALRLGEPRLSKELIERAIAANPLYRPAYEEWIRHPQK